MTIRTNRQGLSRVILEDDAGIVRTHDATGPRRRHTSGSMRARLRTLDPLRADALIAVVVLAEYLFELFVLVPDGVPHRAIALAAVLLSAVGLAFRRTAPLPAAAAVIGAVIVLELLPHEYAAHMGGPYFATFAATFSLGLYAGRRALIAGVLLLGVMITTAQFTQPDYAGDVVFTICIQIIAPVLVGRLLRSRATLNRQLREQTQELERRAPAAADRAVADERTRIAGELHDVVAHALSAMTVQAAAARRLAAAGHASARDAFAAVESTGRDALTELRRLLGVLRREDAELALAPQPSLRHLGSLARRMSASGLPVSLSVDGDLPELPAGIDLTGYRVVQEALAGALEPGGAGRAEVRLRMTPDALELAVLDDGPENEPRPLLAMRERVALHGGRLTAGPRRSGGHAVRARLPFDGVATAEDEPARRVTCPQGVARAGRDRVTGVVRALRRLEPVVVDRTVAGVVAVAAMAEVLLSPDLSGPPVLNALLAAGYALPLAWRRTAPVRGVAVVIGFALAMGLFLTSVKFLFAPFGVILALTYATAARLERRGALTRAGDHRRRRARRDHDHGGPGRRRLHLPHANRHVRLGLRSRRALAQPADGATARDGRAPGRGARGGVATGRGRGAAADRPRDARPGRAFDERDGRAGRRRAPDPRPRPRPGARCRGEDRAHGPRSADRDAPPARRPAPARRPRRARAAAHAGRGRRAGRARPGRRPAGRAAAARRAPAAAGRARPGGVPDRPGGADERAQARRRRAHRGHGRVGRAGDRARGARPWDRRRQR